MTDPNKQTDVNEDATGKKSKRVTVSVEAGVEQNRNIPSVLLVHPAADTSNYADWTLVEDVHTVVIPPNCQYTINAVSAAAASVILLDVGGASVKVGYGRTNSESLVYSQKSPITRLDMISKSGANQTNVLVEASS